MNMIKSNILVISLLISFQVLGQHKTLYDFTAKTIDGNEFDFSTLKGKKVLHRDNNNSISIDAQERRREKIPRIDTSIEFQPGPSRASVMGHVRNPFGHETETDINVDDNNNNNVPLSSTSSSIMENNKNIPLNRPLKQEEKESMQDRWRRVVQTINIENDDNV